MNVLSFDITSRFGYFKRYNATSSGLTYACIPKTAVQGLVGAIIGEFEGNDEKENYLDHFDEDSFRCAVEVKHENHRQTHSINYRKILSLGTTKPNDDFPILREDIYSYKDSVQTPTPLQLLVNPSFRVHVWLADESLYNVLKERLETNATYYPLNMGSSNFPVTVSNVSENEVQDVSHDTDVPVEMYGVAPIEMVEVRSRNFSVEGLSMRTMEHFQSETHPYQLRRSANGRQAGLFHKVVFGCGRPLSVKAREYALVEDKAVIFY